MSSLDDFKQLKLGKSFTNTDTTFHTLKYDFKPVSIDDHGMGELKIEDGNKVTAVLPNVEGAGKSNTTFIGSMKQIPKEYILIVDHDTGNITLEKIASGIQLKKTRSTNTPILGKGANLPNTIANNNLTPKVIKNKSPNKPELLISSVNDKNLNKKELNMPIRNHKLSVTTTESDFDSDREENIASLKIINKLGQEQIKKSPIPSPMNKPKSTLPCNLNTLNNNLLKDKCLIKQSNIHQPLSISSTPVEQAQPHLAITKTLLSAHSPASSSALSESSNSLNAVEEELERVSPLIKSEDLKVVPAKLLHESNPNTKTILDNIDSKPCRSNSPSSSSALSMSLTSSEDGSESDKDDDKQMACPENTLKSADSLVECTPSDDVHQGITTENQGVSATPPLATTVKRTITAGGKSTAHTSGMPPNKRQSVNLDDDLKLSESDDDDSQTSSSDDD